MEKLGPPMQPEQRFSLDTQAHFRQTSHSKISNIKDYGLINNFNILTKPANTVVDDLLKFLSQLLKNTLSFKVKTNRICKRNKCSLETDNYQLPVK